MLTKPALRLKRSCEMESLLPIMSSLLPGLLTRIFTLLCLCVAAYCVCPFLKEATCGGFVLCGLCRGLSYMEQDVYLAIIRSLILVLKYLFMFLECPSPHYYGCNMESPSTCFQACCKICIPECCMLKGH